jgi:hypothetical protein
MAFLIIVRPGWPIDPSAMCKHMWPAMGCADSPADAAKERTPDDRSGPNWRPFVGVADRAEGRTNANADPRPDQSMTRVAMFHPRRLVSSSWISTPGWKRPRRSPAGNLRQCWVVRIGRAIGSLCVFTPSRRDGVLRRDLVCFQRISGLCNATDASRTSASKK